MSKKTLYFILLCVLLIPVLEINSFAAEEEISIDISTGKTYKGRTYVPQIAVWTEDENGRFIETLYITEAEGKNRYFGATGRPEALPVWRNKSNYNKEKGDLDGIVGASSTKSFKLVKNINNYPERFNVFMEVNKSFDYNPYFYVDLKTDEKGYNTGYSGQPSLVYQASFEKIENVENLTKKMKVIGHGSPTGEDGNIDKDISKITTALQILDEVIVEVK